MAALVGFVGQYGIYLGGDGHQPGSRDLARGGGAGLRRVVLVVALRHDPAAPGRADLVRAAGAVPQAERSGRRRAATGGGAGAGGAAAPHAGGRRHAHGTGAAAGAVSRGSR